MIIKKYPIKGEERLIKKFAWFPTSTTSHLIWLEYYYVKQIYIQNKYSCHWATIYKHIDRKHNLLENHDTTNRI